MNDLTLNGHDEAWLLQAITRLVHHENAHQLPPVSSALSARIYAIESEYLTEHSLKLSTSTRTKIYLEAVKSLALSYQTTLRNFAPYLVERSGSQDAPLNVISVCTGFDALVEVIALTLAFGDLAHYVSIELNEPATELNSVVCGTHGPRDASLHFISADIRSHSWWTEMQHHCDQFDLCIALYPPITQTAYSDLRRVNPGERLSDHSDPGVVLELLNAREQGHLNAPIGMIFYSESEAQYLKVVLEVLGYGHDIEFRTDPLPSPYFFGGSHQEESSADIENVAIRHSARINLKT